MNKPHDQETFFVAKCLHHSVAGCDHATQPHSSDVDCRSLVLATDDLIDCEAILNGDLGLAAAQERLLGIRNARVRCRQSAIALQATLRSASSGLERSCEALRRYAAFVALDEFEVVLPAPRPLRANPPQPSLQPKHSIPHASTFRR